MAQRPEPNPDDATSGSLPLLVALGVASAAALLLLQRRLLGPGFSTTPGSLPPSERGWLPFLGLALSFFPDVNAFLALRRQRYTRPAAAAKPADAAVVGPFRILLMGRWWTIVHELADVKLVLNSRESELSFLDGFGDLMKGMLPAAFTFVPRHHFFLPLLREANLRAFVAVMRQEARPLLARLLQQQHGGDIDLFDTCRRAVMHMNLRVLFGPAVLEDGRADAYYGAFEAIDPEKGLVDLLSSVLWPSQKERAWAAIRRITGEMLVHYQMKVKGEGDSDSTVPFECALHLLVRQAAAGGGGGLDVDGVTGDLFAFVFASFTNAFAVLGWCVWELAGNAALCERFLAEAAGAFPATTTTDTTSLDVDAHLPVGKAIIEEVIRLRTPGLFFRKVVAPGGVTLSTGEHVPCGDLLAFSARHVHTHPLLYPTHPEQFDVDRYLVRDEKRKYAGAFGLQWGGGRHVCLGATFATLEILVLLHALFGGWRVERVGVNGRDDKEGGAPGSVPPPYWAQRGSPEVSKSQLGTADKPTKPVYVRCLPVSK